METGTRYSPANAAELRELICAAAGHGVAVEARGSGSKQAIGQADRETAVIDLSAMRGVVDYEPSELVLTLRPATPLAEVEALLNEHGQMLAFEPWDHGPLLGSVGQTATIGGVIAAGVAGPRRLSAGGARDHLLGFTAVSGRAEIFKAGGKVVKNVTGYDLCKVLAGSWGQLAIMTEMSVKVMPRPKATATLALPGLSDSQAVQVMARAMGSLAGPVAAAHQPAKAGRPSTTWLRIEGISQSVDARMIQLRAMLDIPGATVLDDAASAAIWTHVRTVQSLAHADILWRIQIAPSRAAELVTALGGAGADCLMDWAGALVWAAADAATDVMALTAQHGGTTMLLRAPPGIRQARPSRQSQPAGLSALSARVKQAFDPSGILDPNRFL